MLLCRAEYHSFEPNGYGSLASWILSFCICIEFPALHQQCTGYPDIPSNHVNFQSEVTKIMRSNNFSPVHSSFCPIPSRRSMKGGSGNYVSRLSRIRCHIANWSWSSHLYLVSIPALSTGGKSSIRLCLSLWHSQFMAKPSNSHGHSKNLYVLGTIGHPLAHTLLK